MLLEESFPRGVWAVLTSLPALAQLHLPLLLARPALGWIPLKWAMHLKFCCKSRANILWVCTRQLFVLNDTESWNGFGRDLAAHPVPPLPWTGIPSTHYPRVLQTPPNLLGFGFCFSHCMYTVEKNVFKLIKILIKLACFIYLLF